MTGALVRYERMKIGPYNRRRPVKAVRRTKILAEVAETGAEVAETKTGSGEALA
jgi:hypothetical protein